jgi:adenylate cyclase class 2
MSAREIEARFLEIDPEALKEKLRALGAEDMGEDLLEEVIIYDKDLAWREKGRLLRLRKRKGKAYLTYKKRHEIALSGTEELELEVSDQDAVLDLLEELGYVGYRQQEKRRHTFLLDGVTFDIDSWPRIPTYLEIEGPSEEAVREAAAKLGFDWKDARFENAKLLIEKIYNIPMGSMRWFTFTRFE